MSTDRLDAYRALLSAGPPDDGHHWGSTLTQQGDPDRMHEQDAGREGES